MTITALITIDSTDMDGGALAAFVGNEIRGLQNEPSFPLFGPFTDRPMFQITIYADGGGEDLPSGGLQMVHRRTRSLFPLILPLH